MMLYPSNRKIGKTDKKFKRILLLYKKETKSGMLAHTYNPRRGKMEAVRVWVQIWGQTEPQSKTLLGEVWGRDKNKFNMVGWPGMGKKGMYNGNPSQLAP